MIFTFELDLDKLNQLAKYLRQRSRGSNAAAWL